MQKSKEKTQSYVAPGSGIATGVGLGLLFGVIFEDMMIGLLLGVALGVSFESLQKKRSRDLKLKPKSSRKL